MITHSGDHTIHHNLSIPVIITQALSHIDRVIWFVLDNNCITFVIGDATKSIGNLAVGHTLHHFDINPAGNHSRRHRHKTRLGDLREVGVVIELRDEVQRRFIQILIGGLVIQR